MKKRINQIRVEQLQKILDNTPDGAERIARAAIYALPYSMMKRLTDCIEIEDKCQNIKRNQ